MKRAGPLLLAASAAALLSGSGRKPFTPHDKAYYADANLVNFVRPGLAVKITGARIASGGAIEVDFSVTDPRGLPLDVQGVTTPGSVSTSFVAAYIPKGSSDWTALTTRVQTSPMTGAAANQPAADSGGTRRVLGQRVYIQVPRHGPERLRHLADYPHRPVCVPQPQRIRPGNQLCGRCLYVRAQWIDDSGHPRHDRDRQLQPVPRSAGRSRWIPPACAPLHHVPQSRRQWSGYGRSRYRQQHRFQGDGAQDSYGLQPAQRAGGHAVSDHRIPAERQRLLDRRLPRRRPQLRDVPCRRRLPAQGHDRNGGCAGWSAPCAPARRRRWKEHRRLRRCGLPPQSPLFPARATPRRVRRAQPRSRSAKLPIPARAASPRP